MNQQNPFQAFASAKKFDKEATMAYYRKNMETLTEANKAAAEVSKTLSKLQMQFMKSMMDDVKSWMKNFEMPQAKDMDMKKTTEKVRENMNRAVDHSVTMAETLTQGQKDIYNKFKKRFEESMEEIKETSAVKTSKAKH
jgi:phasin family protein